MQSPADPAAMTSPEGEGDEVLDVVFPEGLVGFPTWQRFQLSPAPDDVPVLVLSSLDDPELKLLAVDPRALVEDYVTAIPSESVASLQLDDVGSGLVLALLTVEREPLKIMANLLGPVVINPATGQGRQLVLAESGFTTRHPMDAFG